MQQKKEKKLMYTHIKMFEFIVENRRNFVSLQGDSIIRFNAAMYFVLCSSYGHGTFIPYRQMDQGKL